MLKYLLVAFLLLRSAARATPTGNHTCTGVVKHEVTVRVNVTEPVTYRAYEWCLRVPPRCSTYTIQQKDRIKIHKEMHNRTITVCCKGYVEIDYLCVPACPPKMDCPNMHCNRTNHCYCTPGYTGLYCNDPCPKGVWGAGCIKPCDCPSGYTCHHLTGDCMIDDSPPPKTRRTTTTTTTLAAETSTNFITTISSKTSTVTSTERPTPRITNATSASPVTERLTTEKITIPATVTTTMTRLPNSQPTFVPVPTESTTIPSVIPTMAMATTTTTLPPPVETIATSMTIPPPVSTTITTTTVRTPVTTTTTTLPPPTTTTTTLPPPTTTTISALIPIVVLNTTESSTTVVAPTLVLTTPSSVEQPTTQSVDWHKMTSTQGEKATSVVRPIEAVTNSTTTHFSKIPSTSSAMPTFGRVPYFDTITTENVKTPFWTSSKVSPIEKWETTGPLILSIPTPTSTIIRETEVTTTQSIDIPLHLTDKPIISLGPSEMTTLVQTTIKSTNEPTSYEASTKTSYTPVAISIDKATNTFAPEEITKSSTVDTTTTTPHTTVAKILPEITTTQLTTEKPTVPSTTVKTLFTIQPQSDVFSVGSTRYKNDDYRESSNNSVEIEKNDNATTNILDENQFKVHPQPTITTSTRTQDQLVVEDVVRPSETDIDSDPIKIVQDAIAKYFPETSQNASRHDDKLTRSTETVRQIASTLSTKSDTPSSSTLVTPRVIVSPQNPDEIDLGGIIYRKMKLFPVDKTTTVEDDRFKLYLPNYEVKSSTTESPLKTTSPKFNFDKEEFDNDKSYHVKKGKPKEKETKKYKIKYDSTLTTPVDDKPLTTNNVLLETKEFKVHLASTKPYRSKEGLDEFRHDLNEVGHNGGSTRQMESATFRNVVDVQTESPTTNSKAPPHTWYSHAKEKERIKNALKAIKSTTTIERGFKPTESTQLDDESNDIHSIVTEYNSEREARSAQDEESYEEDSNGPQSFEKVGFNAPQSYSSSSVVSGRKNDRIRSTSLVVLSAIGVVSFVVATVFVVVLGLKMRAKRQICGERREKRKTKNNGEQTNSFSNYETIFPQTDPAEVEMTTFFCPTFTNNYAERINREFREMSYDHPRKMSYEEPLYEEISRCSSKKY